MALKRHHKIIIGSLSFMVIIFMIVSGIFTYLIFVKQTVNYNLLNQKIINSQTDTQSQINILTENLIQTQKLIEESQEALQLEMDLLKASAGKDFSGYSNCHKLGRVQDLWLGWSVSQIARLASLHTQMLKGSALLQTHLALFLRASAYLIQHYPAREYLLL